MRGNGLVRREAKIQTVDAFGNLKIQSDTLCLKLAPSTER